MRDGLMLSCEGLAEEAASAVGAVTDCLPPAFVDCLLDGALEPLLDAAAQRGAQAAKRKKNAGDASEVAKALLTVTVCDPACGSGSLLVSAARRIAPRGADAPEGDQSTDALRRAARDARGGGQLRLRRGRKRRGGGAGEGPAADRGRRPGDDAAFPGRSCQAGQCPDRCEPGADRERRPRRGV